MKPKFKATKFMVLGASVQFIMVDYVEAAFGKRHLLKAYINQLNSEKQEAVRNAAAFVAKVKPRVGHYKYFVVVTSKAQDKHLAHEAVHLSLRVLGRPPYTIDAKEEELLAQSVELIYSNMKEISHRFLKTWNNVAS